VTTRRVEVGERGNLALMLCGLLVQVVGLCWLPSNLDPLDGLTVDDFYAFAMVLAGAGLVGLALVVRACKRARGVRAGNRSVAKDHGE